MRTLTLLIDNCDMCPNYDAKHLMSTGGCIETGRQFESTERPEHEVAKDCPLDKHVEK